MADEIPVQPWLERNDVIKIYKIKGKFGWLHLIVAQDKKTGRKFLRLRRFHNWFSVPDATYLSRVREMLDNGAADLGWPVENEPSIKIEEIKNKKEIRKAVKYEADVPEELIDLLESNPKIIERIIQLCSDQSNIANLSDFLNIFGDNIVKSNERLRLAFKEITKKISKDEEKGMRELSDLMNQWNLFQIASISNIVKQRLETIQTFEQRIHDESTYEIDDTDKSIHRILEKSMWLIDENYLLALSNRSLRTFIGDELLKKHKEFRRKRIDFAVVDTGNKLLILEIKRPSIVLSKKEIDQLELYLRITKQYKGKQYRSVEGILIGNKISSEAREVMEYRNKIELMTYDDLLENCRRRYSEYLKIIE